MPTYEIVNPSDAYTIKGEPLVVCVMVTLIGGGAYGVDPCDPETENPDMPMFVFGGDPEAWFKEKFEIESIGAWLDDHLEEGAVCLESALIGHSSDRRMVEAALAEMPDEESRKRFLAKYRDDKRSSMNDIGGHCEAQAAKFREVLAEEAAQAAASPRCGNCGDEDCALSDDPAYGGLDPCPDHPETRKGGEG